MIIVIDVGLNQYYLFCMKEKLKEQKLFFISMLFVMLFSFPFLKMMNGNSLIVGIPQFYFYIFIVWFAAIFLTWLVTDSRRKKTRSNKDE
jgi:hypothetical protein